MRDAFSPGVNGSLFYAILTKECSDWVKLFPEGLRPKICM